MERCGACGDTHPANTRVCPRTKLAMEAGGPCGTRIDRYEVERYIGGGGMGTVYCARHTVLDLRVALKLLLPRLATNPVILERFMREARAAAAVGNAHIVRVLDGGITVDRQAFLAMELLEGQNLHDFLAARGALPLAQVVDIATQILDGLEAAHAASIVHRDMKPGNVFVTKGPDGRDGFIKLLDFGISKILTDSPQRPLTRTDVAIGTAHFMAPEQAQNARNVDHRADVYAAAVIVYRMLSGTMPYGSGGYQDWLLNVSTGRPARPVKAPSSELPPALVDAVMRGLTISPEERWPSARAFSQALCEAAGVGEVRHATRPRAEASTSESTQRWGSGPPGVGRSVAAPKTPVVAAADPWAASQLDTVVPVPVPTAEPLRHPGVSRSQPPGPSGTMGARAVRPLSSPPMSALVSSPASPSSSPSLRAPAPVGTAPNGSVVSQGAVAAEPAARRLGMQVAWGIVGGVLLGGAALGGAWLAFHHPREPGASGPMLPPVVDAGAVRPTDLEPTLPVMRTIPGIDEFPAIPPGIGAGHEPPAVPGQEGIAIGEPQIVGDLPVDAVRASLVRARAGMLACGRRGVVDRVVVTVIVESGGVIAIAEPAADNPGDPGVARCVAGALRSAGPVHSDGGTVGAGLVTVGVTLGPK